MQSQNTTLGQHISPSLEWLQKEKDNRTSGTDQQTNQSTNPNPPRTCCPAELESVGGDGSKMLTRQVRSVWELDVTPSNWNGGTAPREGE
ncbi:hypothetical protein BDFG_09243 [Blastomyces dermatitidis ATCC 26199]|nr:hypothetical protein BDFG_09243 [Blastomyces dermatitidis ATCC 26199]